MVILAHNYVCRKLKFFVKIFEKRFEIKGMLGIIKVFKGIILKQSYLKGI